MSSPGFHVTRWNQSKDNLLSLIDGLRHEIAQQEYESNMPSVSEAEDHTYSTDYMSQALANFEGNAHRVIHQMQRYAFNAAVDDATASYQEAASARGRLKRVVQDLLDHPSSKKSREQAQSVLDQYGEPKQHP